MFLIRVRGNLDCVIVGLFVLSCNVAIAYSGIVVTAGGNDQVSFHMRSVRQVLEMFPSIDISALYTATGPLYHLLVAAGSWMFSAGEVGVQILGSLFSVVLAVFLTYVSRSIESLPLRVLALSPVMFSPYFWQSSLWMLTDNAALLFYVLGMYLLVSQRPNHGRELTGGLLLGLAIATRQTYVWALLPVALLAVFTSRSSDHFVHRIVSAACWCLPGMSVLVYLVFSWGGLTPPAMRGFNANGLSPSALSYGYAIAFVFFFPILVSVSRGLRSAVAPPTAFACVVVGLLASLPAAIFESFPTERPNDARRGGIVWSALSRLPEAAERSLALVALSFAGGVVVTAVCITLKRELGYLVFISVPALGLSATFGSQLYQKYFELPLAALAVLCLVSYAQSKKIVRVFPLVLLSIFQFAALIAVVVLPIIKD